MKHKLEYKNMEFPYDPVVDDPKINTPEIQEKIKKLKKFFDLYGVNYDEVDLPDLKAYPNYGNDVYLKPQRNLNKWISAVKDIYYKEKSGLDHRSSLINVIGSWDDLEKKDFLNWLRFYEEGAHLKYKYAQAWYEGLDKGYYLPNSGMKLDNSSEHESSNSSNSSERKELIEQQRKKIIGRLDSAEKLLRSHEGQIFAGNEFESLLEILYQLKKKIQLINKKSSSGKTYDDMIIREANILKKKGFNKASEFLYKVADDALNPVPPAPPTNMSGAPTTIPGWQVGVNSTENNNPTPESLAGNKKENSEKVPEGINEFLEGLEGGNITDNLDISDVDDLEIDDSLISEAQAAAPTAVPATPEAPLEVVDEQQPLEVSDKKPDEVDKTLHENNFDSLIDEAFENLKVDDVVSKLEDIAKIFKTREIPRQLSIVDMMLDTLGLSSFFPSLAEATNKALESNQYVLTRVEDILSKLRGTMDTNKMDLESVHPASKAPEIQSIKNKLNEDDEREKARKQKRKEIENQKLEDQTKETPEVDLKGDLAEPVATTPEPTPAPVAAPTKV